MKKHFVFKGIKTAILIAAAVLLIGYVTMRIWNHLIPELFHGPAIGYYQAIGLLILSRIFFGGFKGKGCRGGCGCGMRGGSWKNRFEEKISNLTPDEREKFRKHMEERSCKSE